MSDPFLDTDVIVRLITGDDLQKQDDAATLLKRVGAGDLRLEAPVTVIADALFVLTSPKLYARPRAEVSEALRALLRIPNLAVADRPIVDRALELFAAHRWLDFGDTMLVAAMEHAGSTELYSYDHDFDRVPGVNRREPP